MTRPDTGSGKPTRTTALVDLIIHGLRGAAIVFAAVTLVLTLTLLLRSLP